MSKSKATNRKSGAAVRSKDGLGFGPNFMCYVEGSYPPNKRHVELGEAMNEAERLCRKEQKRVYVLADIYRCEPTAPPVVWSPSTIKTEKPNDESSEPGAK